MMKRKNRQIVSLSKNGEFVYDTTRYIRRKYKATSFFDSQIVAAVICLFCFLADAAVFISLFQRITYDSMILLTVETMGLLFGFDGCPIYLGMHLKKVQQKLVRKGDFSQWFGLACCVLAVGINTYLRIKTVSVLTPNGKEVDSATLATTVFSIVLPLITSCFSFFVSYASAHPLREKLKQTERTQREIADELRMLDALIYESKHLPESFDPMISDEKEYQAMIKYEKNLGIGYCAYVREKIKEHLADPTSLNALTEESSVKLIELLDAEVAALNADVDEIPRNNSEVSAERGNSTASEVV